MHKTTAVVTGGPESIRGTAGLLRAVPYRLAVKVPPNTTITARKAVAADGTVESLSIRLYPGAELSVQVDAWIENAVKEKRSLIDYFQESELDGALPEGAVIKSYVDGDDDPWRFSPREPVFATDDDKVCITITNTDDTNPYDVAVDYLIDYAGGPLPFSGSIAQAGR